MQIITGRAKTGKTQYIYDEIKRELEKNKDENLILLVPELMTYETEYDIIERLNLDGIINLEVLSFKRLLHKILDEMGSKEDIPQIDSLGKIMILREIFQDNQEDLKVFKKSYSHTGFLKQFDFLLQELKQNLISQKDLKRVIESTNKSFLKDKLSDILLIYSQYNRVSQGNFLDEEDIYELVISQIKSSNYIKNSKIWMDGFESFDGQRLNMIKALNEHSKSFSISLNIEEKYLDDLQDFDDWEAFKTIYDTFKSIEEIMEKDIEIVNLEENKIQSPEIKAIEKNIFSIDLERFEDKGDNIEVYSAMDPYKEVEKTGQKIISLVRDEGYRWKDIKIAVSNLDDYMRDIKKLFLKFQIPYFADVKRDITNNPLSKYILSILDIFIWNFKYDDVFEYLKTGFSPLNNNEINLLENYALEKGIQGSKWFKKIDIDFIEEIRAKFSSDFKDKRGDFKNLKTIRDITSFLIEYLELHNIHKKISKQINKFKLEEKHEAESEYLQVWNSVMNIFEQILSIGEDREITPLEYRNILERGLMETKISIIPPSIDRVEIGDIERIAVKNSKALFIIGANEGSLDSNKSGGLLLDEEIKELKDYNIKVLNSLEFSYFKKKHMLYKVFTNPIEKLYISYALGSINGDSLEPSLYIDILNMIFPKLKEKIDSKEENIFENITNKKASYDPLVEVMNNFAKDNKIDDIWKAVYAWYRENDSKNYNIIKKAFIYKDELPNIKSRYVDEILGENINISVTKLENYAKCPFKYFTENILKPEDRKEAKIEFYDFGNMYHTGLEKFIDKIIIDKINIKELSEEDINNISEKVIEDTIDEYRAKISALNANNRNKYLEEKIKRVIKKSNSIIIKQLQRGEFTPRYTELKIGTIDRNSEEIEKDGYIKPLEIEVGDKKIKLRGIIDRVDSFEDEDGDIYLNIIDYKSSSTKIDFTKTYEGMQIQLLVYLKAIIENGEELFGKRPKIAGVYYSHIDDPILKDEGNDIEVEILKSFRLEGLVLKDKDIILKMDNNIEKESDIIPIALKKDRDLAKKPSLITEDEFDAILDYIGSKMKNLSESILDGKFQKYPYRKKDGTNPCGYCEYMSICQFDSLLGDKYRNIKSINRDKFLDIISEKGLN